MIDLSSRDMRSVAGEKLVLLNFVFLYSKRQIKGPVFADFAFVNMRLHIFTYASSTRFLDYDAMTTSHVQNPNLSRAAQTLLTRSRFDYQI